jgi:hypothetical protein
VYKNLYSRFSINTKFGLPFDNNNTKKRYTGYLKSVIYSHDDYLLKELKIMADQKKTDKKKKKTDEKQKTNK